MFRVIGKEYHRGYSVKVQNKNDVIPEGFTDHGVFDTIEEAKKEEANCIDHYELMELYKEQSAYGF